MRGPSPRLPRHAKEASSGLLEAFLGASLQTGNESERRAAHVS